MMYGCVFIRQVGGGGVIKSVRGGGVVVEGLGGFFLG